jgi:D-glycero-D-manno-heptose 1,7-bisphosphate phosphatase
MRAVFFDRDNTLTKDEGYCHKIADFAWIDGAEQALARLAEAGIPVFIVTNQGGIARGIFTTQQMHDFNNHLMAQAVLAGGKIHDIAYCPHHPQAQRSEDRSCSCRKPQAGMIQGLAQKWDITLANSVMIGDRDSDVLAGEAAGCHSYLFDPKTNLDALVKTILSTHFSD